MSKFTVLILGDVTGPAAVDYVVSNLWKTRAAHGADFVVANAENCAAGNGIDIMSAKRLFLGGCDVLTSGNHVFKKHETKNLLDENPDVIRPCNYPQNAPGKGYVIKQVGEISVLVINVLGVIFMEPIDNPIRSVEKVLRDEAGNYDVAILDFHAEATSEKLAAGYFFDGKIDVVFGTHTHVPTADEHILPHGTAYITDVGMCGPCESALGIRPECIIQKLTSGMPTKFHLSENPVEGHGIKVVFGENHRPESIERIVF